MTLDEQIVWVEREIEFKRDLNANDWDIPFLKDILQSLNCYKALLGNKNLQG